MSNDLIIQIKGETALEAFSKENGLEPFIVEIEDIVRNFKHDLSTDASRKKTASLSAKVSKFKVYLDNVGKDLVSEWKSKSAKVDAERKKLRDSLDALRDEARKPLTDWENAEKERIASIKQDIESITHETVIDDRFEEFKADAYAAKEKAIEAKKLADEAEAQRLELEKLRAESEARARADREEALRKEGEERARIEAQKLESERIAGEEQLKKHAEEELKRKELEEEKKRLDLIREKQEAEQRAINAEREARLKLETEKKQAEEEELKRQENIKHNKKIKSEAKADLIALGCDEKLAVDIVLAIDASKVRNISIKY